MIVHRMRYATIIIQLSGYFFETGSPHQRDWIMAYLNKEQRNSLKAELKDMSFRQANGRLKRLDPHGRLAYYRNAQRTGQWMTRWVLTGLGTQVSLVESNTTHAKDRPNRVKNDYELVDVIVEPTPDNRL